MGGRVREGRVRGGRVKGERVPFKYFPPSHCWNAEVMATVKAMGLSHCGQRSRQRTETVPGLAAALDPWEVLTETPIVII